MKIRTLNNLVDFLDDDLKWRKRELTTLKLLVKKNAGDDPLPYIRSAIVLLYAHWEGFTKKAAQAYLNLITFKKPYLRDLQSNFVALGLIKKMQLYSTSNFSEFHLLIEALRKNSLSNDYRFNSKEAIDTEGNLDSKVLKKLLLGLGISIRDIDTKCPLIDERLVSLRHKIAHGERPTLDIESYENLHELIINLLMELKTEIENCATQSLFLSTATAKETASVP